MEAKFNIEQFSSQENSHYKEYLSFDSENQSYQEHVVFPANNEVPHEFADDEVLSEKSLPKTPDEEKVEDKKESSRISKNNYAAANRASALATKIVAGISFVSVATVAVVVAVAVFAITLFPGLTLCKIQSLQIYSRAIICNVSVKQEEEQCHIVAKLRTEDDESYNEQMLYGGENVVEFLELEPDTDYVLEIIAYKHDTEEETKITQKNLHTPLIDTTIGYNLFVETMREGVMCEMHLYALPENSLLGVRLHNRDGSFDETRELLELEEWINVEFWNLTPNAEYILEIICTHANKTTVIEQRTLFIQPEQKM